MDGWVERMRSEIEGAAGGMTTTQLAWHPEGKWCAAQILEHLSLTYGGTAKNIERALAGQTIVSPRTMRDRLSTFVVVGLGYMPEGRPAPKGVVPGDGDPDRAVATILANLAAMDASLRQMERTKGCSFRVRHPVLGPLNVAQWRKFHWVHTRHHMKQIHRLKQMQHGS